MKIKMNVCTLYFFLNLINNIQLIENVRNNRLYW